ncbi:MAG: hypothetical protein GX604_02985 [Actinobacteria bacterium]|nr:hypothetical protein [Actinomycetota bacterium]
MLNLRQRHKVAVAFLLTLVCLLVAWNTSANLQTAKAAVATDLRGQVLEEINTRRIEAGVGSVVRSASLEQAAQAHAEYLVFNAFRWDSGNFSAHTEVATYTGYTGTNAAARARAAGFPHDGVTEDVVRTRNAALSDAQFIVKCWIDAPLHRGAVLDRSISQIGFGWWQDGINHAYVLNSGFDWEANNQWSGVQAYPGIGQEGVPLGWDGNESPQPFPASVFPHLWSGKTFVGGYPLTLTANNGLLSKVSLILRTAEGAGVPVTQSNSYPYVFVPNARLEPGTTYRGVFTYTMAKMSKNTLTGQVVSGELKFHFTTGGGSTTDSTTTTSLPLTTTSTATTTVPTTTTMPSTTTTMPSTTTTAPVTTTILLPAPPFVDVESHAYREAIIALAQRGVVCGKDGRHFEPYEHVLRQQLAKMIVLALDLPVGTGDECIFGDVHKSEGNELYPDHYVAVAAREGIVKGISVKGIPLDPPRFAPYDSVTRAQLITMAVRAGLRADDASGQFVLASPPVDWTGELPRINDDAHGDNIRWAEYNGLLDGIALKQWDVWAPASRGEVAQVLWALVR